MIKQPILFWKILIRMIKNHLVTLTGSHSISKDKLWMNWKDRISQNGGLMEMEEDLKNGITFRKLLDLAIHRKSFITMQDIL